MLGGVERESFVEGGAAKVESCQLYYLQVDARQYKGKGAVFQGARAPYISSESPVVEVYEFWSMMFYAMVISRSRLSRELVVPVSMGRICRIL